MIAAVIGHSGVWCADGWTLFRTRLNREAQEGREADKTKKLRSEASSRAATPTVAENDQRALELMRDARPEPSGGSQYRIVAVKQVDELRGILAYNVVNRSNSSKDNLGMPVGCQGTSMTVAIMLPPYPKEAAYSLQIAREDAKDAAAAFGRGSAEPNTNVSGSRYLRSFRRER